ncbi:MAG TPA: alpha/beta fold hydrolase [Steroidobacteraceae bacterium]|nr:alpha/beta fold hydrolase [Steroidobacteraceae bacterium]
MTSSPAPVDAETRQMQREFKAQLAAVTGGLAPEDYTQAWWDWLLNISNEPEKQTSLMESAWKAATSNFEFLLKASSGEALAPEGNDPRFAGDAWKQWPFNLYAQTYQNWSSWWQQALTSVPGMSPRNVQLLDFAQRQASELASPANYLGTNPDLLEATRAESGQNLVRGFQNWVDDLQRTVTHQAPAGVDAFKVGEQVAVTPGKVVLRTPLMELIQYSAQTSDVYAEPILITPAWIMKYYILDLSPANSMVRYLVEKGHTVFMISWKNPNEADRNFGMDDYVKLGFRAALDAVTAIVPDRKVHTVGYCIGGTLLSIAAARLAAEGDTRIGTLTLLAAQTDFSEPGELSLFISPSQIEMLEAVMHKQGVLDSEKMSGAFVLLRSRDLLWTPALNTYVRGKRDLPNDLMAWNADGTRMPWRMHSEYLHRLYLNNELAKGTFTLEDQPVNLGLLSMPMFVVGTETDHVAPWRSAYKVRGLTHSSDYTFLLTTGGHNAGIVSGPAHPRRRHRLLTWHNADEQLAPDAWQRSAELRDGSWWPTWEAWLAQHSDPQRVGLPPLGNGQRGFAVLTDAPGEYVHG